MANNPIPLEAQQFLAKYIHSIEQLEILCLLFDPPSKPWSEGEVFKHIQSSRNSVATNLRHLHNAHFLIFDEKSGHYFPETLDLARQASEMIRIYRERRVAVIETIYTMPSDPIRQFADAFKIRKDKK